MWHGATALVVDDDADMRGVARAMLESLGWGVVEAGDGVEALECHRPGAFDLVLLDLEMPRLGGLDALAEIRRVEQGLGVVLVSGNPPAGVHDVVGRDRRAAFLAKPFGLQALLRAVACVVPTAPTPPSR